MAGNSDSMIVDDVGIELGTVHRHGDAVALATRKARMDQQGIDVDATVGQQ